MQAELREYQKDSYVPETGQRDYTILETISIDETGFKYLEIPEGNESFSYGWVFLGNRYDQLRSLGIDATEY